jgi:hypothetical protein
MNKTDYTLASDSTTSSEDLTQLVERSSDMAILALIAAHPNAPGTLLAALWTHPHVLIVRDQAKNDPNPRDFAGYDASDEDNLYSLEFAIAQHPNTPQDMLMQFAQQQRFGGTVARNPSASPQVLEMIVRSESHYGGVTIKDIGCHPNTPAAILDIIACRLPLDELDVIQGHPNLSALAREIIAYRQHHAAASPVAIELMVSHSGYDVLKRLLYAPDTAASFLSQIFNRMRKDTFTLILVAQHPNTPPDILEQLAHSTVPQIQDALKHNPNFQPPLADEM